MSKATSVAGGLHLQTFLRRNVRLKNGLQCFVCKHDSVTAVNYGGRTWNAYTKFHDDDARCSHILPILTDLTDLALVQATSTNIRELVTNLVHSVLPALRNSPETLSNDSASRPERSSVEPITKLYRQWNPGRSFNKFVIEYLSYVTYVLHAAQSSISS